MACGLVRYAAEGEGLRVWGVGGSLARAGTANPGTQIPYLQTSPFDLTCNQPPRVSEPSPRAGAILGGP